MTTQFRYQYFIIGDYQPGKAFLSLCDGKAASCSIEFLLYQWAASTRWISYASGISDAAESFKAPSICNAHHYHDVAVGETLVARGKTGVVGDLALSCAGTFRRTVEVTS